MSLVSQATGLDCSFDRRHEGLSSSANPAGRCDEFSIASDRIEFVRLTPTRGYLFQCRLSSQPCRTV